MNHTAVKYRRISRRYNSADSEVLKDIPFFDIILMPILCTKIGAHMLIQGFACNMKRPYQKLTSKLSVLRILDTYKEIQQKSATSGNSGLLFS